MPDNKGDFATSGTESFKLGEQKDRVVLNIQEEKMEGVVIDSEKGKKISFSGNFITDFFAQINRYLVIHSQVKIKDKSTFYHLLSVLINSGIPMVKSLNALAMQTNKAPRLQMIVEDFAMSIEAGQSLSEAMFVYPDVFTEQEIGMVRSGEASGQLSGVLDNLASDTEKSASIRQKIKSAMMYPIVIIVLLIAVVTAMLMFVIPKLTELFTATGAELPLITRIVVGASDILVEHKTLLILSILVFSLFIIGFKRTDVGRYFFDKLKINLPIFGPLFRKAYLSRFARSLSNLLDSNVTIIKTLEITANSVGNEVYRRRLLLALEDIKQGIPLAENLTESDLFPPMLVSMIDVGEKTAQLDEITAKVAVFYEDEVDTAVSGISKIIEPVIMIMIGLSVGIIVAAIMLPIMKLSSLTEAM